MCVLQIKPRVNLAPDNIKIPSLCSRNEVPLVLLKTGIVVACGQIQWEDENFWQI